MKSYTTEELLAMGVPASLLEDDEPVIVDDEGDSLDGNLTVDQR